MNFLKLLDTAQIIGILVQVVLPLIVGFVTRRSMPDGLKAILLLFLTIVTQVLTATIDDINGGKPFSWSALLVAVILGFVTSIGLHKGLWKPTGASDAAQDAGPITDVRR
jgi:hypothetical protein